jgi:hypothetical protein
MSHPIRLQFGLRTLFAALSIGCVAFAAFGVFLQRVRTQQRVIRELREMKVDVFYDFQERSLGTYYSDDPAPNPWLVRVLGVDYFHSVVAVEINGLEFTDVSLQPLWELPHLRSVTIIQSRVSVQGIASLHECQSIRSLFLISGQIAELTNTPNIDGDDAAREIAQLKRLQQLAIVDTAITDRGLRHLEPLTNLQHLTLSGPALDPPRFTKRGMKRLEEDLPDCVIDIDVPFWLQPLKLDE